MPKGAIYLNFDNQLFLSRFLSSKIVEQNSVSHVALVL